MNQFLLEAGKIANLILLIALFIFLLLPTVKAIGYIICRMKKNSIEKRTEKIECHNVIGEVVNKVYAEKIEFIRFEPECMGVAINVYYPREYIVYVKYAKEENYFDDEELFNKYEIGDKIPLVLVMKYDKRGKVLDIALELPEWKTRSPAAAFAAVWAILVLKLYKISKIFAKILTYLDNTDKINTLSRVGERSGLMTPQQPVNMQGANTAKAKALNDSVLYIDYYSLL